jgi:hypothetical protein
MGCGCKNKTNETEKIDQFIKINKKSFNISPKKDVVTQVVDMINK